MSTPDTYMPGNPYIRQMELAGHNMDPQVGAVYATMALAFEQRTANLLAVTEKMYRPGANDEVKERLGWPEGVGTPTPPPIEHIEAAVVGALHRALQPICFSRGDDMTEYCVDGELDLTKVARKVIDAIAEVNGA